MKVLTMRYILLSGLLWLAVAATCFGQQLDTAAKFPSLQTDLTNANLVNPASIKAKHFVVPAVFIGYGFLAVYNRGFLKRLDEHIKTKVHQNHPLFSVRIDDYLQFVPAVVVYGLNLAGIKGRHNLMDASMRYVLAIAIMTSSTHLLKNCVKQLRPNDATHKSFPSGHTASAFAAAEFLHQEYRNISPWYGYAGYLVAATTGVLRMYNNKHWFSDVVAGAGFGIVATKLACLVYPFVKKMFVGKRTENFSVMPCWRQNSIGLALGLRF